MAFSGNWHRPQGPLGHTRSLWQAWQSACCSSPCGTSEHVTKDDNLLEERMSILLVPVLPLGRGQHAAWDLGEAVQAQVG